MLLDEAERNMQVGIHEGVMDPHRRTAFRVAGVAMGGFIPGVMIDDGLPCGYLGGENRVQLGWGGFAMQASRDADRNVFRLHARSVQYRKQWR